MSPRSGRASAPAYALTAPVYDRIYAWKDYAGEVRKLRGWVRRYGRAGSRTLLDVACGSGSHLKYLARYFEATGLDRDAGMLAVARRKLPRVRFVRGRMEEFHLGRRFDVITCLFSAIGYVRDERSLRRTMRTFANHLNPGGVAIVEPWFTRAAYRAGHVHVGTYGGSRWPIVRMNLSERRGDRSIMEMHHLVSTPRGIRHWVEHHDLGLFPVRTYLAAFRAAGLRPKHLARGLMPGRGIYLAVRPAPRAARGARRPIR